MCYWDFECTSVVERLPIMWGFIPNISKNICICMHVYMCECMCVYTYVCICREACVNVGVFLYVHVLYVCVCAHVYAWFYECMYYCMLVYVCVNVCAWMCGITQIKSYIEDSLIKKKTFLKRSWCSKWAPQIQIEGLKKKDTKGVGRGEERSGRSWSGYGQNSFCEILKE